MFNNLKPVINSDPANLQSGVAGSDSDAGSSVAPYEHKMGSQVMHFYNNITTNIL